MHLFTSECGDLLRLRLNKMSTVWHRMFPSVRASSQSDRIDFNCTARQIQVSRTVSFVRVCPGRKKTD